MLHRPDSCRITVFRCTWEPHFRGHPVVDRYQYGVYPVDQPPRSRVFVIEAPYYPAATVKEHDQRMRTFCTRPVNTNRNIASRAGDSPLADFTNRFLFSWNGFFAGCRIGACLGGCDLGVVREAECLAAGEEFCNLLDHDRVMDTLRWVLGDGFRVDHLYGIHMRNGTEGLRLHGGAVPYDQPEFFHYSNGEIFNGLTVVSFNLTDTDESLDDGPVHSRQCP